MKDIITPKQYFLEDVGKLDNKRMCLSIGDCEAYAQYYAKALIESLTDEDMVGVAYSVPYLLDVKDHEPSYRKGIHIGQKWAREELLKRNG